MNKMFVIVFPVNDVKDAYGNYLRMEYLYFKKQIDAIACLAIQEHRDGHEWYEVPYFHGGALVRYMKVLYSWDKTHFQKAEDYAIATKQQLIEFDRAWLE